MFILQVQKSHSASCLCCESVPWYKLNVAQRAYKKTSNLSFSLSSDKKMCVDPPSDELSMQSSRLRRPVGYITYGFFESDKNWGGGIKKKKCIQHESNKNSTPVCERVASSCSVQVERGVPALLPCQSNPPHPPIPAPDWEQVLAV